MEISHIKSISKILTDLCVTRQRVKKRHFSKYCLQWFSSGRT